MPRTSIDSDVVIIGGGIAGLWLLNRLLGQGYRALLFEQDALGSPQTIASQGMIHGGIKYALGGALSGESEAIAAMPEQWRHCLRGEGELDLRALEPLSEHFYLWSTRSLGSRLTSFLASKFTRGRVENVAPNARPPLFDHPDFRGSLYRLQDLVLDVPSLLSVLAEQARGHLFGIDWQRARLRREGASIAALDIDGDQPLTVNARQFVFTAGAGNADLLAMLGLEQPAMQRRPLHQVFVKHQRDYPLYGHCLGNNPSPRLTVSSHRCRDGSWCWYLGGDLATEGVQLDSGALIERAREELRAVLPWLELGECQWATLKVDRAEPRQPRRVKPDEAFAQFAPGCDNLVVGWPTKLTLAPDMAGRVMQLLAQRGLRPAAEGELSALRTLPAPPVAEPYWETLFGCSSGFNPTAGNSAS